MHRNKQHGRHKQNRNDCTTRFTEDDIPINTLYVFIGTKDIDEAAIKMIFSSFGEVTKVTLVATDRNRFAFVSFKKCEVASRVLQSDIARRSGLKIAAADSWHQCGYENKGKKNSDTLVQPTESPEEETLEENTRNSILVLNDDCLIQIFSYLDIQERIKLKETCTRFEYILRSMYKRYKSFDFEADVRKDPLLTLMETRSIFHEIGAYINKLALSTDSFCSPSTRLLTLIPNYCQNLTELSLSGFVFTGKHINRVFKVVFRKLEKLTLKNCGVTDNILLLLNCAIKLVTLNLAENSEITGSCLKEIKNLKSLNIEDCWNIQAQHFNVFCKNNTNLEYLNITRCDKLTADSLRSIVQNCSNLEHIVVNNSYTLMDVQDMNLLSELPKLKNVQIVFTDAIPADNILAGLVERNVIEYLDVSNAMFTPLNFDLLYKLKKLKEIKLNYKLDILDENLLKLGKSGNFTGIHLAGCPNITDKAMLEFVKMNNRLKVIDLSYCLITEELVFSAIDILKEQSIGSNARHLKLIVGNSNINRVILDNALVKTNSDLLELSFGSTDGPYQVYDDDNIVLDDDDDDYDNDYDNVYDFEDYDNMWNPDSEYEDLDDYDQYSDTCDWANVDVDASNDGVSNEIALAWGAEIDANIVQDIQELYDPNGSIWLSDDDSSNNATDYIDEMEANESVDFEVGIWEDDGIVEDVPSNILRLAGYPVDNEFNPDENAW